MLATSPPETTTSRTCGVLRRYSIIDSSRSLGLADELELVDHRRGVADEVHAGAVAAVLRAGRQQLGEHLGGVAVGEPLGHPHVVLVQRVAGRVGVRGPVGTAVAEHRDHVLPDRVGVERVGERAGSGRLDGRRHRVHHLRRHQHRHGRALGLVALEVGVEPLVDEVAEQLAQLLDVLHAVGALPLDGLPLLGGDVLPAGEPGPVGLDQLDPPIGVGLPGEVVCRQSDGRFNAHCATVGGGSPVCPKPRRNLSCQPPVRRRRRPVRASDPTGLHRVLDDASWTRRPAAGRPAARHPPRAVARRGPHPRRAPEPRRGVVPPARAQARGRR